MQRVEEDVERSGGRPTRGRQPSAAAVADVFCVRSGDPLSSCQTAKRRRSRRRRWCARTLAGLPNLSYNGFTLTLDAVECLALCLATSGKTLRIGGARRRSNRSAFGTSPSRALLLAQSYLLTSMLILRTLVVAAGESSREACGILR